MNYLLITLSLFVAVSCLAASNDQIGKEIYQKACASCHAPAFATALKAPPAFDKQAWAARINAAKIKAKDNPEQYNNAYNYLARQVMIGKGMMHHGGLCKEAGLPDSVCNEQGYIAAILYMSDEKNK